MPDPDLPPAQQPALTPDKMKVLINGDVVSTNSMEWKQECLQRHRHVLNMRGQPIETIKVYVSNVRRTEGEEAARRLKQAYADDWDSLRKPGPGQQGAAR